MIWSAIQMMVHAFEIRSRCFYSIATQKTSYGMSSSSWSSTISSKSVTFAVRGASSSMLTCRSETCSVVVVEPKSYLSLIVTLRLWLVLTPKFYTPFSLLTKRLIKPISATLSSPVFVILAVVIVTLLLFIRLIDWKLLLVSFLVVRRLCRYPTITSDSWTAFSLVYSVLLSLGWVATPVSLF